MLPISSLDNPKIKELVALREKRCRDKTERFLIEGYRELLRAHDGGVPIEQLYICPELFLGENETSLIDKFRLQGTQIFSCTTKVFHKSSYRDRPDGLIGVAKTMQYSLQDLEKKLPQGKAPLLVVAVNIEKPGNLGTILRSSDAAGAHGVIVCDRCTDVYNPNVVRASVGTLFTLPVVETTTAAALTWLKDNKIHTIATTPSTDKFYSDINLTQPSAIIVGAEQIGLSDLWLESADYKVKIPMLGVADSLNVAMATTILLYEAVRQRKSGR